MNFKYFLFTFFRLSTVVKAEISILLNDIGVREPISSPITAYDPNGNSYPDPFIDDQIILEINRDNYLDFVDEVLTPGQIEMFENYPETFKMNVYQSRRSCAVPVEVTDLTVDNAILTDNGEGIEV